MLLRGVYFSSTEAAAGAGPARNFLTAMTSRQDTWTDRVWRDRSVTARLANNLGRNIIAHDPMVATMTQRGAADVANRSLDSLLAESDVVSLHVPLIAQTRGMLSASRIALMKRGAIVINSARGGIVDESAVVDALRTGALGGAALDVFENEPLAERCVGRGPKYPDAACGRCHRGGERAC